MIINERIDGYGVTYLGKRFPQDMRQNFLKKYEGIVEKPLPVDYREFLLHYGSAFVLDKYVCFEFHKKPMWEGSKEALTIDVFYGFDEGLNNLFRNETIFGARLPSNIIPIGGTTFDSQVCLCLDAENFGRVYFWDKDDEREITGDRENDFGNVYLVAESFSEFIESLFVAEDKEVHPDPDDDELNESWILEDY